MLLLLCCLQIQAQPIRYFTHFTENEGLSDNHVQCVLRDRMGYLWVGTANGLNRYDGYTFRHYFPDTRQPQYTISNECITDLKEDSAGFIWIATHNGLNRYDPRTETFKVWKNTGRSDGSLPNALVQGLLPDQDGVWLACDNRDLTVFDPTHGLFKTYPWKAFLVQTLPNTAHISYQTIFTIHPKGDTALWLETKFGLFSFDKKTALFAFHPRSGLPAPFDSHVFNFGALRWLLGSAGLSVQDVFDKQPVPVLPAAYNQFSAPTGALERYFIEKNGNIWLGGENGLWLYDPQAQHFAFTQVPTNKQVSTQNTYHHLLDSRIDGRRYLLDLNGHQLLVFEKGNRLKTIVLPGAAMFLKEDNAGTLWVGVGSQIFQLNRKTLALHPFQLPAYLLDPAEKSVFVNIEQDAAGNYWFANNTQGLLVWHPQNHSWWKPGPDQQFIAQAVTDLLFDPSRRRMWIATEDHGLFQYDVVSGKFTLYRYEEDNPTHSLGAYIVHALCQDRQGFIWAATDPGGLSRFDNAAPVGQEFRTLNTENGLPSNQVLSLICDDAGRVWAGTNKGLACVDAQAWRARAFGKKEGILTELIDLPLGLDARGGVVMSAPQGFQTFYPDELLAPEDPPEILFTAFRIFDKPYADSLNINFLQRINLSWREDFFSFDLASTHFARSEKNEFAYRLLAYDADWVVLKNGHSASYTQVPPGHYTLEIKTGHAGHWYNTTKQLTIYIAPPFWETWWFRSLVLLLLAGLGTLLYLARVRQIRREERLKSEFNQRIARTEMAALRAQMNPHFVFNCLSSINRFILVNQPDEASVYLTKFSRLIRLILDNSRTETVPLNKELEALKLYLEMEQMRFFDRFEYEISVHSALQTEHLEVPPLLIQPFVENAIWHGLMHQKTAGKLQIKVYPEGKRLCIEVEDNGVGRQKAMELKTRSATVHKSLGMKVTAERLEVINQLYGTSAEVQTFDLIDAAGHATGTRVLIRL
jgi:ligand-binding sensor domain-containing protein/anti-sigma regulatory factor (Ser/Thr protein kinase)